MAALFVIMFVAFLIGWVMNNALVRGLTSEHVEVAHKKEKESGKAPKDAASKANSALELLISRVSSAVPLSSDKESAMRRKLNQAGMKKSVAWFHSTTILIVMGGAAIGAMLSTTAESSSALTTLMYAGAGGVVGYMLVQLVLAHKIKTRRLSLEASLPNVLNLLAVTVSAGQSVEHGFRLISQRMEGPLADEFGIIDAEISVMGYTRVQALQRFSDRCQVSSVSLFASALMQATEQGSSVAATLESQAAIAQTRFSQQIEERANKIPVKMLFPLVALIMPAVFIVVLSPAVGSLLSAFMSM